MINNNELSYYNRLEKRFSIFRLILLVFVAPVTFHLSHYYMSLSYFIFSLTLACIYSVLVIVAAYNKHGRLQKLLKLTIHFDILFISVLLSLRGGLRSDLFVMYFLVISYSGTKFGFRGTMVSLFQSLLLFTAVSFFFTPAEFFELNRYIIRMIHLILMTFVMLEVNRQVNDSRIKERAAKNRAYKDPLTGLPNRLVLPEKYDKLQQIYKEKGHSFILVLFDIDNFKLVNDTMGHTYGDKVLEIVARILEKNISGEDFVCRFGGEEFLAFLTSSDKQSALVKVNNIRKEIAAYSFFDRSVTVSAGINLFQERCTMIENISFADEAMYAAKNAGKNQVVIYQDLQRCLEVKKLSS